MKHLFNRSLRILLATNAIILFAGAMLGPIYALFVEEIGGSLLDASIAGGVFALAAGFTTLISGRYTDKLKENEYIIVLGYLVMAIGFYLYVFVDTMFFLLVVQVIIGLGEAIYSPAFDALYSKHISKKRSGREWAAWESMYYFTAAIAALVGGLVVTNFSFEVLFIAMGTMALASAVYIALLPRKIL